MLMLRILAVRIVKMTYHLASSSVSISGWYFRFFRHCKSCSKVAIVIICEFNVVVDGVLSGMVGRFMEGGGGKYQDVWFEPGEVVAIASVT